MDKKGNFDDNIIEILIGSFLIGLNNFHSGILLEKIFVLLGLLLLVIGIFRTDKKCIEANKKGMVYFLTLAGFFTNGIFLALCVELFFPNL